MECIEWNRNALSLFQNQLEQTVLNAQFAHFDVRVSCSDTCRRLPTVPARDGHVAVAAARGVRIR